MPASRSALPHTCRAGTVTSQGGSGRCDERGTRAPRGNLLESGIVKRATAKKEEERTLWVEECSSDVLKGQRVRKRDELHFADDALVNEPPILLKHGSGLVFGGEHE